MSDRKEVNMDELIDYMVDIELKKELYKMEKEGAKVGAVSLQQATLTAMRSVAQALAESEINAIEKFNADHSISDDFRQAVKNEWLEDVAERIMKVEESCRKEVFDVIPDEDKVSALERLYDIERTLKV